MHEKLSNAATLIDFGIASTGTPVPVTAIAASILGYFKRSNENVLLKSMDNLIRELSASNPENLGQAWSNLGKEFGENGRDEIHLRTLQQIESSAIAKLIARSVTAFSLKKISATEHYEILNVLRRLLVVDLKKIEEDFGQVHISRFPLASQGRISSVGLTKNGGYGISSYTWNQELLIPLLTVLMPDQNTFEIATLPDSQEGFMARNEVP